MKINSIGVRPVFKGSYVERIDKRELGNNLVNELKAAQPELMYIALNAPDNASLRVSGNKDGIKLIYVSENGSYHSTSRITKSVHKDERDGRPLPLRLSLVFLAHTLMANARRADKLTS